MDKTLIIDEARYLKLLAENEELKNMLNLYQSSQAITSSLEIGRVYRLLVEAVSREIGVSRAIALFVDDTHLDVKEVKGMSESAAGHYRDEILTSVMKRIPPKEFVKRVRFHEASASIDGSDAAIKDGYLIFIRNKNILHGVIALFNDPGQRLPDIRTRKKNILFLLEQSAAGFENVETYSLAKDMLFIDDLTGLYNYRYLELALNRELKRAERYASNLSILFLDLDTFKQVNDCHGHLVGSKVLIEMGEVLKKTVRDVDVVIRYGGDEYTVILVETDSNIAGKVAERIRKLVESHLFQAAEGRNIHLTCSIGFACCPEDSMSKDELLEMADKAMYVVKASGRNCIRHFTK